MNKSELQKTLKRLEVLSKLRSEMPVLKKIQKEIWEMCKTTDNCKNCPFDSIQPPIYVDTCAWSALLEIRTLIEHM